MIVINSSTRQFNIPGADMTFGVEADAGSERKYFQCPRYVGNKLDLTGCFVRMNYRNANGEIDSYLVEDLAVDGDNVTFSWELSPKVTAYKGQLRFVMCVVGPDTKVAWHTTLGTGIVLEGLEPDYAMIQAGTADVVAQLIAMTEAQTAAVENKGAEWVRNVQSEGTDQIIAVQTAGQEARAAAVAEIEAKGVNTRESIPDDYTALSEAVDGLVRGRACAIVCEVEGSAVVVNDASDLPMQGLRVFGKTTQATTTGVQLIPYPYFNGNKTHNGVTWTINPDGSVKAKGTATATSPLYFTNSAHELAPGQYTVSGSTNGVTVRIDSTIQETGKWKAGVAISKNGEPVTFTVTEEDTATYFYTIYASVENGNTVDTTIYPMLNAGSSALPWEIYTGGKPSPSPDYPQELVSLGPTVGVYGRNLLEITVTSRDVNGGTLTVNADKTITLNGTVTQNTAIAVGKTRCYGECIFSTGVNRSDFNDSYLYIAMTDTNIGWYGTDKVFTNDGTSRSVYMVLVSGTYNNFTLKPMIRPATSMDTTYETYIGQTLELTHTLPGIPVTSGGNYTDSDGQQWVCDEVDLERSVYIKRVNSTDLGTLEWTYNPDYDVFLTYVQDIYPNTLKLISTHYKTSRLNSASSPDFTIYGRKSGNLGGLGVKNSNFKDAATFKSAMSGVMVLYEITTPIETPLSETEIAVYRALHSNYPNTTVLNDSGAHMVVKYAADTKLYIDNKIAALVGG